MHLSTRINRGCFAQDAVVRACHGLGAQQGHWHIVHAHKAHGGLVERRRGFLRHGGGLRFLPGAHSAFLVVQICQAQRVADVQNFCLAQPAALQRDHHIFFLCARYDDSRLAQNAVLDTGAGGAACQQGHGRVGNALQTIKGLIEHFANFLGQCRVGSTLPAAGNTVFLSHSRNWFHRLCRKCVCLYRAACQQGKIVDDMPAQVQRGAGQLQPGFGRSGAALHADVQTQGIAQGRQQGACLGQQGRRTGGGSHGQRTVQGQRRGQHVRGGHELQRARAAQSQGPGVRLKILQGQHGPLTGPQGQLHPQGGGLPGRQEQGQRRGQPAACRSR